MTTKDAAKQVIDTLPEDASLDDIIHALYLKAMFERGDRQIDEGKCVPHEEARKRLLDKWVR